MWSKNKLTLISAGLTTLLTVIIFGTLFKTNQFNTSVDIQSPQETPFFSNDSELSQESKNEFHFKKFERDNSASYREDIDTNNLLESYNLSKNQIAQAIPLFKDSKYYNNNFDIYLNEIEPIVNKQLSSSLDVYNLNTIDNRFPVQARKFGNFVKCQKTKIDLYNN